MASKPTRQAQKQAQLRAEQERKRKQQQYLFIGGGIAAAVLVLVGVFFVLNPQRVAITEAAPCANLQTLEDEGRGHLNPGDPAPVYKSVPPTSGTHNPIPLPAGVYGDNADVTQLVHSLEHGYIVLYYNGLTPDQIAQLTSIQGSDSFKVIVAPYPNMPYKVALAAWAHLQTCDGINEQAIRSFTAQFRNQGPEQAP